MKIRFINADELLSGITLLETDLDFTTVLSGEELCITVKKVEYKTLTITLNGNVATITYGDGQARFFRGLATVLGWIKDGLTNKSATFTPSFDRNGAMIDVSRGIVLTVETVKATMRGMALMGLNTYMLYTEDVYEIEGRPYFGHARGRYTQQELKELDAYALSLGIELVPCIQVLGHMEQYLRNASANGHKDTDRVLLAGADETFCLIEDMLNTVAECFTTRRLHIGMDETHDLGRGKYLDVNGYRKQQDIFFEHLERVRDMAIAKGFKPMIWSDMFFRLAGKDLTNYREFDTRVEFSDEVKAKIPKGVTPVFWDYYRPEYDFYSINIEKHRNVFGVEPIFAGGVWLWSSYGPLFSRSLDYTLPALNACKDTNLKEVLATVWANENACQIILSMAGLAWYADFDYVGTYDEDSVKRCFRYAFNEDYDTVINTELPEHPDGQKLSLTTALLFNDPLLGLADTHFKDLALNDYYKKTSAKLSACKPKNQLFAPAYKVIENLSKVLELKADFGIRLKSAYDKKDIQTLANLALECDEISSRITALKDAHYDAWEFYNKPQGYEQFDIRYGGLIQRFNTVKRRVSAFLNGKINRIEELEEERLRIDGGNGDLIDEWILWTRYTSYISAKNL